MIVVVPKIPGIRVGTFALSRVFKALQHSRRHSVFSPVQTRKREGALNPSSVSGFGTAIR
jgi:hypothetical protein